MVTPDTAAVPWAGGVVIVRLVAAPPLSDRGTLVAGAS